MIIHRANKLLTERQKEIVRYRAQGMTQQQIADLLNTSKGNIRTIEKTAGGNIPLAKEILLFIHTIDAQSLCTLKAESDLLDSIPLIMEAAGKLNIPVSTDPPDLINRLRAGYPQRIHGRHIREDSEVFLQDDGEQYFG
ncbi:MAG: Tfx family DNA-binding protein [Methanoregulaceae archaeon]